MSLNAFAAEKKKEKEIEKKKNPDDFRRVFFFFFPFSSPQARVRLTRILEHVVASPLKKRSVCSTLSPDVTGTARTSEGGVRLQ